MKVRFTLLTELLATQPKDEEVFQTYIASKAPEGAGDEALGELPEDLEKKGMTVFRRDPLGVLCVCDYHIKGMLKSRADNIRARLGASTDKDEAKAAKEAIEQLKSQLKVMRAEKAPRSEIEVMARKIKEMTPKKTPTQWGMIKGKLDEDLHVFPRLIPLGVTEPDGILERPLRAMTMQGPRVSLAASEYINADRSFECEILIRPGRITEAMVIEMLQECMFIGLGQWRGAGYGRLIWEKLGD